MFALGPPARSRYGAASDWRVVMGKRLLMAVGGVYLTAAVVGHVRERFGAISCECGQDCWCRRPGLSLFRWVAPVGHRG